MVSSLRSESAYMSYFPASFRPGSTFGFGRKAETLFTEIPNMINASATKVMGGRGWAYATTDLGRSWGGLGPSWDGLGSLLGGLGAV